MRPHGSWFRAPWHYNDSTTVRVDLESPRLPKYACVSLLHHKILLFVDPPCSVVVVDILVMCLQSASAPCCAPDVGYHTPRIGAARQLTTALIAAIRTKPRPLFALKPNRSLPCVALAPRTMYPFSEPVRQLPHAMALLFSPRD